MLLHDYVNTAYCSLLVCAEEARLNKCNFYKV